MKRFIPLLLICLTHPVLAEESSLDVSAITLTRFAIQSLYAPARLIEMPEGVSRTPMHTQHYLLLIYGASITAKPIASWHGGKLYVTAIELKNDLNREVTIDPRQILGHWQTATIFPTNVLPPRNHHHTTTVFLTSDKPFHEALMEQEEFIR